MSKARDLADIVAAGSPLVDGTIETTDITNVTASATELNYTDGVTSNIQTQLDTKVETLSDLSITATATELNYVDGVTSNIQTQLDTKAPTASPTFTGDATFDTDTLAVDSTNNRVGIGTTSPSALLEIKSSSPEFRVTDGGGDYSQFRYNAGQLTISSDEGGSASGVTVFKTNATERLRIGSSGELGIGGASYGTAGQVLTSGGSGAAPSWADAGGGGTEFISAATVSSTTYVDISLPSGYDAWRILFQNMMKQSTNAKFEAQLSFDGGSTFAGTHHSRSTTFDSASDYSSTSGPLQLSGGLDVNGADANGGASGEIIVYPGGPTSGSNYGWPTVVSLIGSTNSSNAPDWVSTAYGNVQSTDGPPNLIRLRLETSGFDYGRYVVYGVKNS